MSREPYDPQNHSAESLERIADALERIADALNGPPMKFVLTHGTTKLATVSEFMAHPGPLAAGAGLRARPRGAAGHRPACRGPRPCGPYAEAHPRTLRQPMHAGVVLTTDGYRREDGRFWDAVQQAWVAEPPG